MEYRLLTASEVNQDDLHNFLLRFFGKEKSNFLSMHGEWLHVSNNNRWVILDKTNIVGYCAIIPTKISFNEKMFPALWWVDIIIAPEYRGHGLQSIFDKKIQESKSIKLGFPNEVAARIHRKHGWGVREDLEVRLLPLKPTRVYQVRCATGLRAVKFKTLAVLISPVMLVYKYMMRKKRTSKVVQIDDPHAAIFSDIYHRYPCNNLTTTVRDEDYFNHQFITSPVRHELSFYTYGPLQKPTHYLIARKFDRDGEQTIRILDLYGNFNDRRGVRELIHRIIEEAIELRVAQITVMATDGEIKKLLSQLGFLIKTRVRFCWKSYYDMAMDNFDGNVYWTLADSDNDEID